MLRDFLSIHDLSPYEFNYLLDLAKQIKNNPRRFSKHLKNKKIAILQQPPSPIPGIPFEFGITQLGGQHIGSGNLEIHMDKLKNPGNFVKILERWVDGVIIKTISQSILAKMAHSSQIPFVNIQTEFLQPCQAMTDFFILKELGKDLSSIKLSFIGKSNNLCHSLIYAAAKAGACISVAAPPEYEPQQQVVKSAESEGKNTGFEFQLKSDPLDAIRDATVIYTAPGASYFFPKTQILKIIKTKADPDVQFMNYLPESGGISAKEDNYNLDQSIFFDQAESILHIQKAIMVLLFESKK